MRVWTRFVVPTAILVSATGCLTAGVVRHATDPHPSFRYPDQVTAAAIDGDQLYLTFTATQHESKQRGSVVIRVAIPDIRTEPRFSPSHGDEPASRLPKLPVRVEETASIPSTASPVPVRRKIVATLSELDEAVLAAPGSIEVWVVDPKSGGELETYSKQYEGQTTWGPILAIVNPSVPAEPRVSLYQNYVQLPRTAPAWWLVTPFSAVGDIVLLPGYIVYMLCGGS